MPYTVAIKYVSPKPASAEHCAVRLTSRLAATKVKSGESVRLDVEVRNVSGKDTAMATAILGLPGGLTVRTEELKKLVEQDRIAFFETRGREVILYWRALAADATEKLTLNPVADIPGSFSGPASRAYLYYSDDVKWWVDPLKVEITR